MKAIKLPNGGNRHLLKNFTGNLDMRFDEAVLGEGTASAISNFDVTSGALTDGYGLATDLTLPVFRAMAVWEFTRYDADLSAYLTCRMFCSALGEIYYNYGDEWVLLEGIAFTSAPSAVVYRLYGDDCVLMTSATDGMYVWDGVNAPRKIEDSPLITSMAMHYERMFATTAGEMNTVYFSDDLDPTNWDVNDLSEGGFIQMMDERGKMLKVVDFLNYVYVFREFGISRITAYAAQSEFSAINLYVAGGRIYGGSVCPCGDVIMFLGSDGLHLFDGYSVSARLKSVKFKPSFDACSVYADGKYYLAAVMGSGATNDTLVVYDIKNNTFTTSKVGIARLCKCGDCVYAVTYDGRIGLVDKCGAVFGVSLEKIWESGEMDFGSPTKKTIAEVSVRTATPITFSVEYDGNSKEFVLGAGNVRIKPMIAAKTVKFGIKADGTGTNIKRLSYLIRG